MAAGHLCRVPYVPHALSGEKVIQSSPRK